MSVFFEYEWRKTPFHEMHPLTKLFLVVCVGINALLCWHPIAVTVLIVAVLSLGIIARIPKHWYKLGVVALGFYILSYIASIFRIYNPSDFVIVDPTLATTVLVDTTPVLGFLMGKSALTIGGLMWLYAFASHLVVAVIAMYIFLYTTSMQELVAVLVKRGAPTAIATAFIAMLRFASIAQRKAKTIFQAQKLRGWELSKNPLKLFKSVMPFLFPVTRTWVSMVDQLTTTLNIRGYGYQKPTPSVAVKMRLRDKIIIPVMVAITGAMIYLYVFHNIGKL